MIPVLRIAIKWHCVAAIFLIPSFIFSQSLSDTTTINITKTWFQETSGYTYPLDIYVPDSDAPAAGFPVCITLHSGGKVGDASEWSSILSNHIIVAPSGYEQSWNIAEEKSDAPDVEMVSDLIDSLQTFSNVNPNRIRILGTSLGAAMANRVFIENKDPGVDIVCAGLVHLSEASFHNDGFYLPTGMTGDGGAGLPPFEGYTTLTTPVTGRKYLNISNLNDAFIPYEGGLSPTGLRFLNAQDAAFEIAKSQGYSGFQLSDSTQVGSMVYEFSYLSGQVVHLNGLAMHSLDTTQINYIQTYFGGIGSTITDTVEPDTMVETDTMTETQTDTVLVVDADQDGIVSTVDCDDNDANVRAKRSPGFPCDDGDEFTRFDQIQPDSCTCLGVHLCAALGGDEDEDGICAEEDCDDTNRFIGAKQPMGTSCNDQNPNTEDDQILENGCDCAGTVIDPTICIPPRGEPTVAGLGNKVVIEWNDRPNARSYTLQIRFKGKEKWLITTTTKPNRVVVTGTHRSYEYRLKTNCVDGVISEYGPIFDLTLPFSGIGTIPAESRNQIESIKEIVINEVDATSLYPNPASNGINLVYKTISEESIFKIYDRMGRTIFSQALSKETDLYLFDIASLPSGIYLGAVFEKGELRYAEQFYKQSR